MRHVPLVLAAFETVSEAERAVQSLLDAGFHADAIRAAARAGGGRLLLAGRVAVQPVAPAAQLADGDERALSAAFAGAVAAVVAAAAVAFGLRLLGLDPLATWAGAISPRIALIGILVVCAALGAVGGAASRRATGLPHDLALRYARRLERGDVVIGVSAGSAQQARSIQETLAVGGASDCHVTRGVLESVGGATTEDAPVLN